jgi:hypothetical protein
LLGEEPVVVLVSAGRQAVEAARLRAQHMERTPMQEYMTLQDK